VTTLYDLLGVRPGASQEEIRRAYHERARALHPDRRDPAGVDDARSQRRMQEVNEAWRILRDPATRAVYDRRVLHPRPVGAGTDPRAPRPEDLEDDTPYPPGRALRHGESLVRALPWLALAVVLAAIFVFTAVAGGNGDDRTELIGRCVSLAGGRTTEVPCEGPNDGKVALVVDRSSRCPLDSDPRSVPGDRWLCLRPPTTASRP